MAGIEPAISRIQTERDTASLHLVDVPNHTEPLLPLVRGATNEMFLEGMPRRDHRGRALTPI